MGRGLARKSLGVREGLLILFLCSPTVSVLYNPFLTFFPRLIYSLCQYRIFIPLQLRFCLTIGA